MTKYYKQFIFLLFLVPFEVLSATITWDAGAGDGLWSSANNWSTNTVPGDDDDVVINGSYTIVCNVTDSCKSITLQPANVNTSTSRLRITSGARLGVRENIQLDDNNQVNNWSYLDVETGSWLIVGGNLILQRDAGNNYQDMIIRLNDNSSKLTVIGDININLSSYGIQNNAGIEMQEDSQLDAANINLTMTTAGGQLLNPPIRINTTGTTGDAAVLNVSNDFTVLNSTNFDFTFDLDYDGGISIGGNFSYTTTGTGIFYLVMDRDSYLDVTSNFTVNHTGAGYIDIDLNTNADGAAADAQWHIGGDFTMTKTTGGACNIDLNRDADIDVDGDWAITYNTMAANGHLSFTLDNDAKINVDNDLTITRNGANTYNINITLNNNTSLDVHRDLNIDIDNGTCDLTITISSASTVLIRRDFVSNINASSTSDYTISATNTSTFTVQRDLRNVIAAGGGISVTFNVNTAFSVTEDMFVDHTSSAGSQYYFIDGAATFTVGDTLKLDHKAAGDFRIVMNGSTGNDGQLTADELIINKTTGTYFRIQSLGSSGDINIDNNLSINLSGETGGGGGEIYINYDGRLNVGKNFDLNINFAQAASRFAFNSYSTTELNIGIDDPGPDYNTYHFTITYTGGTDFTWYGQSNPFLNVYGDFNIIKNGGGDMDFVPDNAPTWHIYGDLDVDNNENADQIYFRFTSTSVVEIDKNLDLRDIISGGKKFFMEFWINSGLKLGGTVQRKSSTERYGFIDIETLATFTYDGTASQVFAQSSGNGGDSIHYSNVIINNTSAAAPPHLTMEGNAFIQRSLTFTDGVIESSSSGMPILVNDATGSDGNGGSYVDGPYRKVGDENFTFALGDGTVWARCRMQSLTNYAGTTVFTAQYFHTAAPNPTHLDASIFRVSGTEYWDLSRTYDVADNASCQVVLYWEDANRSGISNYADLLVAHYRASTSLWTSQGASTVASSPGNITSTIALSDFSPITISSAAGINTLPVELLTFKAQKEADVVKLYWETASEINNDHFTLERSSDGCVFDALQQLNAAGNSSVTLNYSAVDDSPLKGVSYYRLKQTDYDGTYFYSHIVPINFSENLNYDLRVYPNPHNGKDNISFEVSGFDSSPVLVVLRDVQGKEYYSSIIPPDPYSGFMIEFTEQLASGVYFISASSNDKLISKKLIVE